MKSSFELTTDELRDDTLARPLLKELQAQAQRAALDSNHPIVLSFFEALAIYNQTIDEHLDWTIREADLNFVETELRRNKLKCRDTMYTDYITQDDVIEIYNSNHQQIFRNFRYFLYSSYSVFELVTSTWSDLFERSDGIVEFLEQDLMNLFTSDGSKPCVSVTPTHRLKERSARQFEFEIRFKFGWPLFNEQDQVGGYMITSQVTKLNPAGESRIF